MGERKNYKTKQKMAILEFIQQQEKQYITINQIAGYLKEQDISVGLTTIYRAMEKLENQGYVHRIKMDGIPGACFQYIPKESEGYEQFYVKCEKCGEITDLDCSHLTQLYEHVKREHDFRINPHKTMFYGICSNCKNEEKENVIGKDRIHEEKD